MKVNAIIAEYNPLHKGHEYLIEKGRQLTGADYTVVIMSGCFVQRGEPAVADTALRTEAALIAGADLVIELPLYYSTASAEYFAKGAVSLIDRLGICNNLVFGCETDDIELLSDIARLSADHEKEMYELIVKYMSDGNSYARAQSLAICDIIPDTDCYPAVYDYSKDELAAILAAPNSTLAICYIKSIMALNAQITPVAVKRIKSDYNDVSLGALSSSAVRKELYDGNYNPIREQLPDDVYRLMAENVGLSYPVCPDDFSDILLYKLRSVIFANGSRLKSAAVINLTDYLDVSESLAARIVSMINEYKSFSQFVALIKTKNTTYSHISRALLHILLDIKKSNASKYIANDYALYARLLGFYRASSELLSVLKAHCEIPVISKLADAENTVTDPLVLKHLYETINASEIYSSVVSSKFSREFIPEPSRQLVIL